jgi:hypothetical protein
VKIRTKDGSLYEAQLKLVPLVVFDELEAISPDDDAEILHRAGVRVVEATDAERRWLRRHRFELPLELGR